METKERIVCFYVTGHGYGHATRVIGQVSYLLEKDYKIHIVTSLDPKFFYTNLMSSKYINIDDISKKLICHQRILDAGAVQIDPLHVDIIQSLSNYYLNIHRNHHQLVDYEKNFLIENNVDIVLVDATPLPLAAAKAVSIPSVIVSNFTWDVTYEFLLQVVSISLSESEIEKFKDMVKQCNVDVCSAKYYLRLPGITPLPTNYTGKVISGPMICRKARTSRDQTRKSLHILESTYVLVLGFGGFKLSGSWAITNTFLPNNWVCIVLGSEGDPLPSERFIPLARDAYVPDIIAASDAVLGKLGYGTVSECLSHGIPLLYVPRTDWPEEEYLSEFIMKYNAGIRITEEEFLTGQWESYLSMALEKKGKWDISDLNVTGAFEEVETIIRCIINRSI